MLKRHPEHLFSSTTRYLLGSASTIHNSDNILVKRAIVLQSVWFTECSLISFVCKISRGLINRITLAEQSFPKDFPMEPKAAPVFDLHLQNGPALQAIQSLNFYHMKG